MSKLFAVVAVVGLAASAQAAIINFTASLDATQEVPPNTSPAFGHGDVALDTDALTFTFNLTVHDLTAAISASHIHQAPFGVNGPVIFGIGNQSVYTPAGTNVFTVSGGGTLTLAQALAMIAGNTYFNVHTQNFPGGEIRGQIVPSPGSLALLSLAGLATLRRRR